MVTTDESVLSLCEDTDCWTGDTADYIVVDTLGDIPLPNDYLCDAPMQRSSMDALCKPDGENFSAFAVRMVSVFCTVIMEMTLAEECLHIARINRRLFQVKPIMTPGVVEVL